MIDITAHWHWPQWIMLALLFLRASIHAGKHGQPMLEETGPEKGQTKKYNGFNAIMAFLLWGGVLTVGGFFA